LEVRRKKLNAVIRAAIAGDAVAREELCMLYAKTILFQSRLLVKNREDAEDVAQKVAIEMLKGIGMLKSPYAFRSWLQQLIITCSSKQNARVQREARRTESLESAESIIDESLDAQPEEGAVTQDFQRYIGGYLEQLSSAQAIVLTLFYYEQMSYREISQALGVSLGAVSNTMSKAKKNLKNLLKNKEGTWGDEVLGIVFIPSFMRNSLAEVVRKEVNSAISPDAVDRLMQACRSENVLGVAGVAASATGVGTTFAALSSAIFVLAGVGLGAYLLGQRAEVPVLETPPAQEATLTTPNAQLYFEMSSDEIVRQAATSSILTPVNPSYIRVELLSNETLGDWTLTAATSDEIAGGVEAGSGPVFLTGQGGYVDIAALALSNGDYVFNWFLTNAEGYRSRIYWEFTIAR
jgi:RNA polymerase sigma-70 factor (ECF subfamily)